MILPGEAFATFTSPCEQKDEIHTVKGQEAIQQSPLVGSSSILAETTSQYRSTVQQLLQTTETVSKRISSFKESIAGFLAQPVIIPRKKRAPRKISRMRLFLEDTGRFGLTFAFLFIGLFVSMNYQSFWEIFLSQMLPFHQASAGALTYTQETLRQKLLQNPQLPTAGRNSESLLAYLPQVGPPENRILIPKLELNIPLVSPSYQALLDEDWTKLEEEIQEALMGGVVHYPGTARPGQAGNFFVTGHSSYYPWAPGKYKTVFARLNQLQPGDEYWVYFGGDRHRYVVRSKKEVSPGDVTVLDQPLDQRISTLMTCTPVGTTLRRLIISAEEVDPETGITLAVGEHHREELQKTQLEQLPI